MRLNSCEFAALRRTVLDKHCGTTFAVALCPTVFTMRTRLTNRTSSLFKPSSRFGCSAARGFTLLELMTVVFLVALIVLIAIPTVGRGMRESRASQLAQQISVLFQEARARAMGRGSAVAVRYDASNGTFSMLEAVASDPDTMLPSTSCSLPTDRWTNASNYRDVRRVVVPSEESGSEIKVHFEHYTSTAQGVIGDESTVDTCFTPGGVMMFRQNAGAFVSHPRTIMVHVSRQDDEGRALGLVRTVFVLPSGMSRVAPAGVSSNVASP